MNDKARKIPVKGVGERSDSLSERDADFSALEEESEEALEEQEEDLPPTPAFDDDTQGEDQENSSTSSDSEENPGEAGVLKAEVEEFKAKYLRALADLENYKKRAMKERSELLKYQGEKVFFDILEIVDNLELALDHAEAEPDKLKEGLELIHKRFVDILGKWEVRSASGLGEEFDPNRHAALSRVPADGTKPGLIVNELKKAYFYKDRLLRAGEVVVTADMEPKTDDSGSEAEGSSNEG